MVPLSALHSLRPANACSPSPMRAVAQSRLGFT